MRTTNSKLLAEIASANMVCESHIADGIATDEDSLLRHLENVSAEICRMLQIVKTGETTKPQRDGKHPVYATVRALADANQLLVEFSAAQRTANRLIATIEFGTRTAETDNA